MRLQNGDNLEAPKGYSRYYTKTTNTCRISRNDTLFDSYGVNRIW